MRLAEGIIGVAGYGLAGLAAVSLLLGAFLTNNTLHFNGDSREAAGVVVGHNETMADGKPRYSPLVAFTTETGERIEFRGPGSTASCITGWALRLRWAWECSRRWLPCC